MVVEYEHAPDGSTRARDQFDGLVQELHVGEQGDGLGLVEDGAQLLGGCAGLQRDGDDAGARQRGIDDREFGARETEHGDAVAGDDGIGSGEQGVADGLDLPPGLAVGDGVVARQQPGDGAAGVIGDVFDGALPESGPVGVGRHDRADHVGQPDSGLVEGGADSGEGPGGGKLRVGGAEVSDALRQLVSKCGFFVRHNNLIN